MRKQTLKEKFKEALEKAKAHAFPEPNRTLISIEHPPEERLGDYSTPVALAIGKAVKKNPMEVAEKIVQCLELPEEFEQASIAKPGFINVRITPAALANLCATIVQEGEKYGATGEGEGKTVVTDISHPNIAKPMGVHHLLSTVIGNALNRMFAFLGYTVIRDNYLGDWGTQFGKLIYAYKTWGNKEAVQKNPIQELLALYVRFHNEAEKDKTLDDSGREEFKKLENGDAENHELWQWIVAVSLKEFREIWNMLDVSFDVINGESFYQDKMEPILQRGIAEKIFVEGERGALICEFPDEGYPPAVVRKGDGATLYHTRDLARIKYWEETWHPDLMVNVVDVAQKLYFQQLFVMAEKLKLTKAKNVHVSFGRMQFPEGRMSTRKGTVVRLDEVLKEAVSRARKIVEEKNPDCAGKEAIAKAVGIGAVKYAVLAQHRQTDVIFTWEKMLSLEGNTAPYVQYAHARAKSILKKQTTELPGKNPTFTEEAEYSLLRRCECFPEILPAVLKEYAPHILTNYLFDLATAFNSFYHKVPVLKAETKEKRESRLALVKAVAIVLKNGLHLLSIEAPEEM